MPRTKGGKGKGKKVYKKRNYKKRNSNVPEYASLSCKRTLAGNVAPNNNFGVGQLYSLMNTSLDQFPRAVQVAGAYQHYRIKQITLTVKTSFDTFNTGVGTQTKTSLYWMIDKSGAIPTNVSLEGLKQMGARQRQLDEKNIIVKWAPSVLDAAMSVAPASTPAKYHISPWLATNLAPLTPGAFVASTIDHLGVYWYLDAANNPGGFQYQCEVEVQFQFKKPLTNLLTSTAPAYAATLAVIDDSRDGIVGGHDGEIMS